MNRTIEAAGLELPPTFVETGQWARANFETVLLSWIRRNRPQRVFEIGGGRAPLLPTAEGWDVSLVDDYVVNDVCQEELDLLGSGAPYTTSCFDIQDPELVPAELVGKCDLVYSKMVMEHIRDPKGAWASAQKLLRPGGIALMYFPTLYSPPFVLNRFLPNRLSAALLRRLFPERNASAIPKFPAYYRWCRASEPYLRKRLTSLGFHDVAVQPFYGNGYLRKIPVLGSLDNRFHMFCRRREWAKMASFAFVAARK